ncbi:hypothetical protein BRARA_A00783 [Brassica rapa]|uniref:HMA domain-containing protein n=1 Tax=Brassica campestris TaxID=3711 RepID=A0A398AJV0_BRACM|nr:hypothetical protein BRARA_A00783 [Brassica rapa]
MEDLNFPICILKMDLQCCEDFASRVKKRLRKVKGVYAITIVPTKGLILVSGTAEPQVLITAVQKIGQTPKLYAYEKDPAKAKTQFGSLLKRYANKEEHRDEPTPPAAAGPCPLPPVKGFGHPVRPTMPMFSLPRSVGPPGWYAPGALMARYEAPKVMPRKEPAKYPLDYYDNKGFPAHDSPFRYFSDDHAQPCSIM